MGNGRNKYRKMNSSVKAFSVLRRMAKPPSTSARMGFYLLGRIPTTFLGPKTLTLPSPSQRTLWFLGRVEAQTFVSGFQPLSTPPVPHADASYGEHEDLTGPLNHHSLSRRIYQGADLIPVLHLGKPSGLLRRESRSKFAQQFFQLIWDFPTFSQRPYTVLLFQNCVESDQWNYFSVFPATDAKVYTKLTSDVLFTICYFLLIPYKEV